MTPIIGGLISAGLAIIDKIIPDPQEKAKAQIELLKLQQQGEFKQMEADLIAMQGQLDINKIEAASPSLFKSGWRPATGWTCAAGFAYMALFRPLGNAAVAFFSPELGNEVFPSIDTDTLMVLLSGLLGFGGFRTWERVKGKI